MPTPWRSRDLHNTLVDIETGKIELRRHRSVLLRHRAGSEPLRDFHLDHGRTLKESPHFVILASLSSMTPPPFPPSEAYDAKIGKMMERGVEHFLKVSGLMLDEDPRYSLPSLKEAYHASKRQ